MHYLDANKAAGEKARRQLHKNVASSIEQVLAAKPQKAPTIRPPSGLHPVSSQSCYMYVRAGRPAIARLYVGVHRNTSLMSSSLFLQHCPAYLVRLAWIVFVMRGTWPYSWCLVGCCRQDLFNIVRNILVWLPSSFFSSHLDSVQVVHPYSSIDTTAAWKKLRFILSVRSDFHVIDSLSIYIYIYIYIYI